MILFPIFLLLNAAALYGAFTASSGSLQLYIYSTVAGQVVFMVFAFIIVFRERKAPLQAKGIRRFLGNLTMLVLIISMIVGFIYWLRGENSTDQFTTYLIITAVSLLSFWCGYHISGRGLIGKASKYLIGMALFDILAGFLWQFGAGGAGRSSVGISRNGIWLLLFGHRALFVLVTLAVLYFVVTNGMRIGFVSAALYLVALFFIVNNSRRLFIPKIFVLGGLGAILLSIIFTVPLASLPYGMQSTVLRLSQTLVFDEGITVEDGRDLEAEAALDELNRNDSLAARLFGRGAGFTFYNPRTFTETSHIHSAEARMLTRYGIVGTVIMAGAVMFIILSFVVSTLYRWQIDIMQLSFLHYLAFFMFFGEDVFPMFWFAFGGALASVGAIIPQSKKVPKSTSTANSGAMSGVAKPST